MASSLATLLNDSKWDSNNKFTIAGVLVIGVFVATYVITYIRSTVAFWQMSEKGKTPAIAPYAFPGLGNLFAFAFDTLSYLTQLRQKYGASMPVRINVGGQKFYYISGPSIIQNLFRSSKDLTTDPSTIRVLHNTFGWPAKDMDILKRDKTGTQAQLRSGAPDIGAHNRIFHNVHLGVHNNLSGSGLADLGPRFARYLEDEMDALEISEEWIEIPNFYHLVRNVAFQASIKAIYGSHIQRIIPNLTRDFWDYDSRMTYLFKNIPRLFVPRAYELRDQLRADIMRWQKFAKENQDPEDEDMEKVEWEEFWGSKLMRERARFMNRIDGMTAEAWAANDLGMMWGANANIVPMIAWELIDTFIRPDVLARARADVQSCVEEGSNTPLHLNFTKLFSKPLLLSIYAEELRLRNGVIIQRVPVVDGFSINGFNFPKDRMIVASSWHEQRDREVWNQGGGNGGEVHDVEDFWADRFVVYPDDPFSGPRKPGKDVKVKVAGVEDGEKKEPRYNIDSVAGSFIPYGGGAKVCPGRFYAKQEAVTGLALFITKFDVEFLGDKKFKPNTSFFPFGVVPPLGDFRVKIRRRKV